MKKIYFLSIIFILVSLLGIFVSCGINKPKAQIPLDFNLSNNVEIIKIATESGSFNYGGFDIYKVKIDSSEYIVAKGVESISIIKNK